MQQSEHAERLPCQTNGSLRISSSVLRTASELLEETEHDDTPLLVPADFTKGDGTGLVAVSTSVEFAADIRKLTDGAS
jgi:hypothetical protein